MSEATRLYARAPSDDLMRLLEPEGFLAALTRLKVCEVAGLKLDVHLRADDEVHVYCDLARLLAVRRGSGGNVTVSAHKTFSEQEWAGGLFREWQGTEGRGFEDALKAYLDGVKVDRRHTAREGAVQAHWSRVTEPWVPFDRESVLGGSSEDSASVRAAREELEEIARSPGLSSSQGAMWARPPAAGREVDQLAIDADGRLVLLELKDALSRSPAVYYAPFQLLQYVWGVARGSGVRQGPAAGTDRRARGAGAFPGSPAAAGRRHPRRRVLWRRRQDRRGKAPLRQGP